jgi:hypothetical protein
VTWSIECADALTAEVPASATVVITDPPYGFGKYPTDTAVGVPAYLARLIGQMRTVAVFGYPEVLCAWAATIGPPTEWITWWPTNKNVSRGSLLPKSSEHVAIYGSVPGARRIMRPRSMDAHCRAKAVQRGNDPEWCRDGDVWRDPSPGVGFNHHLRKHPNEKPESLMRKLVLLCSEQDDIIFDPFAGSGTTIVAARAEGRSAIGYEIVAEHVATAAKRLDVANLAPAPRVDRPASSGQMALAL